MNFIKTIGKKTIRKINETALSFAEKSSIVLNNIRGDGYVSDGLRILISVVVGALLLTGLYKLFGTTIMPTVTSKVTELFNYKGT